MEAVVARALDSLHAGLLAAVGVAADGPDKVAEMLDRVYDTLVTGGHARALLWLALEGYGGATMDQLHVRPLAVAVHEVRCALHKERNGKGSRKRLPPFEDTYFSVLLPALALLSMSVMDQNVGRKKGDDDECGAERFREWLARLVHAHLEQEP